MRHSPFPISDFRFFDGIESLLKNPILCRMGTQRRGKAGYNLNWRSASLRSADFQSAVSQRFQPARAKLTTRTEHIRPCRLKIGDTAEWNSALRRPPVEIRPRRAS